MEEKYCYSPFYMAEISNTGDVFPCCPRYINFYSFGNIYEQTFEDIWYSQKANEFREKILHNDYSLCNRGICMFNITKTKKEIFSGGDNTKYPPVKFLRFAYDITCNVACKTCRDSIIVDQNEKKDLIFKKIESVLNNVEIIQLSTSGDIFSSIYGRNLIQSIIEKHPLIKFYLDTNGILLDQDLYNKLKLSNKIELLNISIPGATKKTYDKIVKNGNYRKLKDNIKFLIKEKDKGNIKEINIIMVIHKLNYKEMPLMAKYAAEHNINIFFSCYQPWEHTEMAKHYKEMAVFESSHPDYQKFLKILRHPYLNFSCCGFESNIDKLRNINKTKDNTSLLHRIMRSIFD